MNNDKKIIELKEKIKIKKEELSKYRQPVYATNLILKLDNVDYNINTLNEDELFLLLIKITSYINTYKEISKLWDSIERFELPYINGFSLEDWREDIINKLISLRHKKRKRELSNLEDRLPSLMSESMKTQIELDEISSYLESTNFP